MINLLETELRKLVMKGKVHPNTAREALNKLEACQNLKTVLQSCEEDVNGVKAYITLREAVKKIIF